MVVNIQVFLHLGIQKSKGRAEDELFDGGAKLAKIRPMREEMYGTKDKISNEAIRRDVACNVYINRPKPVPDIATDSGETTFSEMILAVPSIKLRAGQKKKS